MVVPIYMSTAGCMCPHHFFGGVGGERVSRENIGVLIYLNEGSIFKPLNL
jgi:hypothetical protein